MVHRSPLLFQLILAQLVNENGEDAFDKVVAELRAHSLLAGVDECRMTPAECRNYYLQLLDAEGIKHGGSDASTSGKRTKKGESTSIITAHDSISC